MRSHFWRYISEERLSRMVALGGYLGASSALDRARILRKGGHAVPARRRVPCVPSTYSYEVWYWALRGRGVLLVRLQREVA
jgi:hypothetical protein